MRPTLATEHLAKTEYRPKSRARIVARHLVLSFVPDDEVKLPPPFQLPSIERDLAYVCVVLNTNTKLNRAVKITFMTSFLSGISLPMTLLSIANFIRFDEL